MTHEPTGELRTTPLHNLPAYPDIVMAMLQLSILIGLASAIAYKAMAGGLAENKESHDGLVLTAIGDGGWRVAGCAFFS